MVQDHPGTDESTLQWLSSEDVPPVRYLVAREFGYPEEDSGHLDELHDAVLRWEPLRQIIDAQKPDGSFPNQTKTQTGGPTLAALMLMARCGLNASDDCVNRAIEYIVSNRLFNGVFTVRGRGSGVLPCYAGMLAHAVSELDGTDHPIFKDAIQWIVDYQRFDHRETRNGGRGEWPFKSVVSYGGCWSSVSCFHGVVPTLRALGAVPAANRSDEVNAALDAAIEYLRIHRVYKKSSSDKPLFRHSTKLYLYGAYRSNLLDTLEGIAVARPELAPEPWIADACAVVDEMAVDGKLVADESYRTEIVDPVPLERAGEPSRFLTYQWMKVKAAFGGCYVATR